MENSTPKCMSTWGNKDKPLHFWASFLNMQCSRCALAYQHSGQPGFQLSRVAGFQLRFQGSRPVQKDAGRADQNIGGGVMQVTFLFGPGIAEFLVVTSSYCWGYVMWVFLKIAMIVMRPAVG